MCNYKSILTSNHKHNTRNEKNKVDLTGNTKHGFKHKRSSAEARLTIQTVISHALGRNEFALMSSIDLSAAFDVISIKLY